MFKQFSWKDLNLLSDLLKKLDGNNHKDLLNEVETEINTRLKNLNDFIFLAPEYDGD